MTISGIPGGGATPLNPASAAGALSGAPSSQGSMTAPAGNDAARFAATSTPSSMSGREVRETPFIEGKITEPIFFKYQAEVREVGLTPPRLTDPLPPAASPEFSQAPVQQKQPIRKNSFSIIDGPALPDP